VKETIEEWLKPLGVPLKKNKPTTHFLLAEASYGEECPLASLLPPEETVNTLVHFYINHVEQIHRLVHVPTFMREYSNFWVSGKVRQPGMVALVLAMMSTAICSSDGFDLTTHILSKHKTMVIYWISACDQWLARQTSKQREIVHHQIACLTYLAKRFNMIHKKRYWKETALLVQNAIVDDLHHEASSSIDSFYTRELKLRIWVAIRELDLQNSFEFGLPTLLHSIDCDSATPANIDDEDFDETSPMPFVSKPLHQYSSTSYQSHSCRSWRLRLGISRRLFSIGSVKPISYDDVLRYTQELTEEIHSLPPWNITSTTGQCNTNLTSPMLAYAFLRFQLIECILAIHRPYLQSDNSRYWLSENICYQLSRDALLLNIQLQDVGIQSLTLLREDLLLASLTLTRLTMQQAKGWCCLPLVYYLTLYEDKSIAKFIPI
jgi:hypothetical protein